MSDFSRINPSAFVSFVKQRKAKRVRPKSTRIDREKIGRFFEEATDALQEQVGAQILNTEAALASIQHMLDANQIGAIADIYGYNLTKAEGHAEPFLRLLKLSSFQRAQLRILNRDFNRTLLNAGLSSREIFQLQLIRSSLIAVITILHGVQIDNEEDSDGIDS